MEEEKRDSFFVTAGESIAAFDLDYSQLEISETQKLREEDKKYINRMTLRKLVADHPFFATFFHWLRYDTPYVPSKTKQSDDSEKKSAREKNGNAIPVELLPFVKLYMLAVMSKRAFSTSVKNGKAPEEMQESFKRSLLEYAGKEEQKADSDDSELYWTRRLFNDASMKETAARNLWETEYGLRVEGLYDRVKRLPPEQQLSIFFDVASFLNNQIALASRWDIIHTSNGYSSKTDFKQFLTEFPKSVISKCRERIVLPGSKARAAYKVDNMPLRISENDSGSADIEEDYSSISSLKDAFVRIRGNIGGSLKVKKAAREVYLRSINKKAEKSDFQIQYENTLAYVNACTVEIDPERLKKEIASRAAAYFGSAFRGELAPSGFYLPYSDGSWPNNEVHQLIQERVLWHYNNFFGQYGNYLGFINKSLRGKDNGIAMLIAMAEILWDDQKALEKEDVRKVLRDQYMQSLSWSLPKKLEGKFVPGLPVTDDQCQSLAEEIVELSKNTFQELEIEPFRWVDVDTIERVLMKYNAVLYSQQPVQLPPGYEEYDVMLRQALITIKVGEAFEFCCQDTEQHIVALTTAIKEMKKKQV